MRPTPGDHTLDLSDGRTIAFTVYGDAAGAPVLNCHGGRISGHDVGPADQMARSLGLCLISPDRPGIHRTDRLPGHGLLPWVRSDLEPLLDHLEIDTMAVMGWSEGGQYALATAYALSGRVTRCAVIAGCPPLDDPDTFKRLNRLDRALAGLARRAPMLVRAVATGNRQLAKHRPGMLLNMSLRGVPDAEVASVRGQGPWLPTILGEGAANSAGVVDEYRALVAPWGFEPEDLSTPVRIYQGTEDPLVPESWARELADRIPGASLTLLPSEGHFIALTRRRDVLVWLAGGFSTKP
jgi:pimeloyl-ACP methyl ester carboxylesterase